MPSTSCSGIQTCTWQHREHSRLRRLLNSNASCGREEAGRQRCLLQSPGTTGETRCPAAMLPHLYQRASRRRHHVRAEFQDGLTQPLLQRQRPALRLHWAQPRLLPLHGSRHSPKAAAATVPSTKAARLQDCVSLRAVPDFTKNEVRSTTTGRSQSERALPHGCAAYIPLCVTMNFAKPTHVQPCLCCSLTAIRTMLLLKAKRITTVARAKFE